MAASTAGSRVAEQVSIIEPMACADWGDTANATQP
jgi:hypothetical protein